MRLALAALLLASLAGGPLEDLGAVPAATTRLVLIRHGQAFTNLDPEPDLPPEQLDRLTDLGRVQARQAGTSLRGSGIRLVLSSPAGRARETADEVRSILGAETRVEPRLRPLDLGRSPAGAALQWDERIAEWKAGRDPAPPGGESLEQVGRRVAELVSSLKAEHAGKTLVLVAHSEVIGAYLGFLRGTPGFQSYPPRVSHGALTVVEVPASGPALVVLSNHVPASPSPVP